MIGGGVKSLSVLIPSSSLTYDVWTEVAICDKPVYVVAYMKIVNSGSTIYSILWEVDDDVTKVSANSNFEVVNTTQRFKYENGRLWYKPASSLYADSDTRFVIAI